MDTPTASLECPLCGSSGPVLETIDWAALGQAWRKSYGVGVPPAEGSLRYASCTTCRLGHFQPVIPGDEALYETLQQHAWYYLEEKPEYDIAARYLPSEGPVLEVGAGMAAFSRRVGASRYTGLEFNEAAIERASRQGIRLVKEMVQDHAKARPGAYSAVASFQVLEHVPDPRGFVEGCCAALQPGGTLILAVPNHDGLCGLTTNNILDLPPHHLTHWTEATLRHLAHLFPLEVVAIEKEPLADIHRQWAEHVVRENQIRHALAMPRHLFDAGLAARVVSRAAREWAKLQPPGAVRMDGHTILAVLRKVS